MTDRELRDEEGIFRDVFMADKRSEEVVDDGVNLVGERPIPFLRVLTREVVYALKGEVVHDVSPKEVWEFLDDALGEES